MIKERVRFERISCIINRQRGIMQRANPGESGFFSFEGVRGLSLCAGGERETMN
jgi:hypothetical protein